MTQLEVNTSTKYENNLNGFQYLPKNNKNTKKLELDDFLLNIQFLLKNQKQCFFFQK